MRFATAADRAFVDAVMNDPVLRVWKRHDRSPERCDPEPYLTPPSFTVVCDDGCFPIHAEGDGCYAVHVDLLPACRGLAAVERSREAMEFIFDNTDARVLLAYVPAMNPRARWVSRQLGFEPITTIPNAWPVAGQLFDIHVLGARRPS